MPTKLADVAVLSEDESAALPAKVVADTIETPASAKPTGTIYDTLWFGRDGVDTMMVSGAVLARGYQEILTIMVTALRDQVEETMALGKALSSAKSFSDIMGLSASFLNHHTVRLTREAIRLSELANRLSGCAATPVKGRMAAAFPCVPASFRAAGPVMAWDEAVRSVLIH